MSAPTALTPINAVNRNVLKKHLGPLSYRWGRGLELPTARGRLVSDDARKLEGCVGVAIHGAVLKACVIARAADVLGSFNSTTARPVIMPSQGYIQLQ